MSTPDQIDDATAEGLVAGASVETVNRRDLLAAANRNWRQ